MKKRNLSLLFVIIIILFVVSACSNNAEEDETQDVSEETQSAEDEGEKQDQTEETEDQAEENEDDEEPVTILVAAAASMEYSLNEIIEMFEAKYSHVTVEATYDSSGKLQTQIEEGLEADVFLSAAMKQMDALKDQELVDADSVLELLENKVVLIVPATEDSSITGFDNILDAETIAIGDPESVPVGQYAEMILNNMGIYDEVLAKASLGTNVTQVLNWIAEGSADAGIVYATDAATTDTVRVIEEAPEGTLDTKVIYPTGIISSSKNKETANLFIEYLQTEEGASVLEKFGFSMAN